MSGEGVADGVSPNHTAGLPIVNDQENCLSGGPLLGDSLPLAAAGNSHQAYGEVELKSSIATEQHQDQQQQQQHQQIHPSRGVEQSSVQQLPTMQPPGGAVSQEQGNLFHVSLGVEGATAHSGGGSFNHPIHSLPHHDAGGVLAAVPPGAPVLITRPSSAKGSKGPLVCQVQGCSRDLTQEKKYYKRYRVCMDHLKMREIYVDGQLARFCQQCGRFHDLSKFDGQKRNCRERLSQHNCRRRKSKWASMSGAGDGSWEDGPAASGVKVPRGPRSKRPSHGAERPRVSGGFWDVADGQAGGVPDGMDPGREEKPHSLTALVQGSYAVGQPSTSGLGTVEGIPVTQGFRRQQIQVGGARSAFKQFADGTVQGAPTEGTERQDSLYERLVQQKLQHQTQAQTQQALVHMGLPTIPARPPEGVPMDGMDASANQLSNIPPVPMLLIPAASAAEIMQQLRGSAVALFPTTGSASGAIPVPVQRPQTCMMATAVAVPGAHPLAIPAPTQWTSQSSLPQMPISSATVSSLNPILLPPTVGAGGGAPFDPTNGVRSSADWRSEVLPMSQVATPALSMEQMGRATSQLEVPIFSSQPLNTPPGGLAVHPAPTASAAMHSNASLACIKADPAPIQASNVSELLKKYPATQGSSFLAPQSQLATSYSPGQQVNAQVTECPGVYPHRHGQVQERFLEIQKMMDGEGPSKPPQFVGRLPSRLTQGGGQVSQPGLVGGPLMPPLCGQGEVSKHPMAALPHPQYQMDGQKKVGLALPHGGTSGVVDTSSSPASAGEKNAMSDAKPAGGVGSSCHGGHGN